MNEANMNWISVKDGKPKELCGCWVANNKHDVCLTLDALYYPDRDIWVAYDPKTYHHPCLEVTHYIIKPPIPAYERQAFS
jgi:hypothetical protein